MTNQSDKRDRKYHLWGWGLFVVCATFFIASGIRNGDMLSLAASILFLVACVVFLVPLLRPGRYNGKDDGWD